MRADSRLLRAGRDPFTAAARRALAGPCGIPPGAAVVLGVSGGPDSLALLYACAAILKRSKRAGGSVRPFVVHVDHHLRPGSGDDARFVARRCKELGVPCHVVDVHPAARAGNRHAAARELRYAALANSARSIGAAFVVTAHHADDQLETMIMALCRGTGLDGLSGMPWRRELRGGADGVDGPDRGGCVELVRPLLGLTKLDCERFCRQVGVRWRTDPGNADERRARGRLRSVVLPALEAAWPGAAVRSQATAEILAAARAAVDALVPAPTVGRTVAGDGRRDSLVFDREALRAVSSPIAALAIRRAAISLRPEAADAIDGTLCRAAVALATGARRRGALQGPGGLAILVDGASVSVSSTG